MAKIIILRGNSGSGKTTTAKRLQKKLGHGTMFVSQDVVRREILYVKDGWIVASNIFGVTVLGIIQ